MAGQNLELKQTQALIMTQQLQQSIKMLQLSTVDLRELIASEIEKNPLLQEGPADDGSEDQSIANYTEASQDTNITDITDNAATPSEQDASIYELDTVEATSSYDNSNNISELIDDVPEHNNWEQTSWSQQKYSTVSSNYDGESNIIEQTIPEGISLQDHLLEHLFLSTDDIAQRLIGRHLIDLVDESGYLPQEYTTLSDVLNCDLTDIDAVVEILQKCEPAGLCARNLAECLALQLKDNNRYDPAMQMLIDNLQLLSRADYARLEKICGVDREDLRDMVAEIKKLNPKPGLQFHHEVTQQLQPDILITQHKQGWHIELNQQLLPKVLVNRQYYVQISKLSKNKNDKKYLNEQLANANWLVKALDQRAKTMLKVSREIVKRQENFFRYGIRYLQPLTLKEVAEAVDMHESTVSRVTSNKYMATPSGIYELKYFFTSSIQSAQGSDISSKTVQHLISEIIAAETADNVLSDDAIASALKEQGVDVARRTVAKYRDILHIPSSTQRRRLLRNKL